MEFSSFFNQYFQHKEPWKKGPGTVNCVYLSVNAARAISIALFSFLPESSQKIWEQLGLDGETSTSSWGDMSLLAIAPNHVLGDASPIFAKVEASDVEKHKSQLGPSE
jgi:methionyl-tRNA synthetase